jgi:hypothetical protein
MLLGYTDDSREGDLNCLKCIFGMFDIVNVDDCCFKVSKCMEKVNSLAKDIFQCIKRFAED